MRIHITLVGREVLPAYYLIKQEQPDITYLIATKQSKVEVKRLEVVLQQKHINCYTKMVDAYDIECCYNVCEQIHLDNGERCEYCYNLTGGTKPMAFGVMKCAQFHNARMVYTTGDDCINIETFASSQLDVKVDNQTIFALQGQKLKSYEEYCHNALRSQCAKDIKHFINEHIKVYDILASHYRKYQQIPKCYQNGLVTYTRKGNGIVIEYDDVEIFSSDYPGAFKLLFEGRWWEVLVADAINAWSDGKYEIWTNVVFDQVTQNPSKKDKNEIDILVNVGSKLLFVECKSGAFTQDNIYKLGSVSQTYGSYKSKSILVPFRKELVRQDLREKAQDEKVDIIFLNSEQTNLKPQLDGIIKSQKA